MPGSLMALSPLQLLRSHFSEIQISENPSCPDEFEGFLMPGISIEVNHLGVNEDKIWTLEITFGIKQRKDDEPYPLLGTFKVQAQFAVNPATVEKLGNDDKVAQFVVVNGGSILYSSVREVFSLLSSRFPYGILPPLPTLNLQSIGDVRRSESEDAAVLK